MAKKHIKKTKKASKRAPKKAFKLPVSEKTGRPVKYGKFHKRYSLRIPTGLADRLEKHWQPLAEYLSMNDYLSMVIQKHLERMQGHRAMKDPKKIIGG